MILERTPLSLDKTSNIAHVYQKLRPDIVKVIDKKKEEGMKIPLYKAKA